VGWAGLSPAVQAIASTTAVLQPDVCDASSVTYGTDPDPDATVEAAEHLVTPFGGITDVLVRLRQALLAELSRELVERLGSTRRLDRPGEEPVDAIRREIEEETAGAPVRSSLRPPTTRSTASAT
jgi:hypothetical protein